MRTRFCWYFHFHFVRLPGHVTNASHFIQSSTFSFYICLHMPAIPSHTLAMNSKCSTNSLNICWWGRRCPFSWTLQNWLLAFIKSNYNIWTSLNIEMDGILALLLIIVGDSMENSYTQHIILFVFAIRRGHHVVCRLYTKLVGGVGCEMWVLWV